MTDWNIHEAVEYYKGQDAPQNQFALVELLKEAQEHNGGVLTDIAVEEIAALLNTKVTFLNAVIKRYPSLKTAQALHRLEVCGGKNCAANGSAALLKHIRQAYGVENGGISVSGGFSLRFAAALSIAAKGRTLNGTAKFTTQQRRSLLKNWQADECLRIKVRRY